MNVTRRAKSVRKVKEWGRWTGNLTSGGRYGKAGREGGNRAARQFLRYTQGRKGSLERGKAAHMLRRVRNPKTPMTYKGTVI